MSNQEKIRHKEEMLAIIEESRHSELTHKAFCRQKGIPESMFYYWQKKYREAQTPGGFIPIRVNTHQHPVHAPVIEIAYPNGVVMRLPATTPAALVKGYLKL